MTNDEWFTIMMVTTLIGTPIVLVVGAFVLKGRDISQAFGGLAWFALIIFLFIKSCTAPLP